MIPGKDRQNDQSRTCAHRNDPTPVIQYRPGRWSWVYRHPSVLIPGPGRRLCCRAERYVEIQVVEIQGAQLSIVLERLLQRNGLVLRGFASRVALNLFMPV